MVIADVLPSSRGGQENFMDTSPSEQVLDSSPSHGSADAKKLDPLSTVEALQINFFRILKSLRQSPEDILVGKVLYQIRLATLIRAGESGVTRMTISSDKAGALAAEQEASQRPVLDFSIRILVLGKIGAGKSATINSLFNQTKATTNAFQPSTSCIQEITSFVDGFKISVIDNPGYWPSSTRNV